jgi:hypothetical protein
MHLQREIGERSAEQNPRPAVRSSRLRQPNEGFESTGLHPATQLRVLFGCNRPYAGRLRNEIVFTGIMRSPQRRTMRSFLKRIFGRRSDRAVNPSPVPSEYRFKMILTAVDILAQFAQELRALRPPEVPDKIASTRDWMIRFEALLS